MPSPRQSLASALFLVAAAVAYRLMPLYAGAELSGALAGTAPLLALAFCGGLLLPRHLAAGVTIAAFVLSDVALNLHYGAPLANPYSLALAAVFVGLFAAGWRLRRRRSLSLAFAGTLAGTLGFYVVANTLSFFADPAYSKTAAGWLQSQTTGLPGFPPSWVFGLRLLAGNLVFAPAFYLAARPTRPAVRGAEPQAAAAA